MVNKVQDKQTLKRLLASKSDQIRSFGVRALYLFGSFKRDKDIHDESDIDFLVDFEPGQKTFDNLVELGELLEQSTNRKVELVTREGLSKYIGPYILNDLEYVAPGRFRIS